MNAGSRSAKVVSLEDALLWRHALAAEGRKVVFTNGCFDLLHRGHVELFRAARAEGDVLVVGLNGDLSMRRLKGPTRPLVAQEDRAEVLAALEMVDRIVVFDDDTPARLIDALVPDVLVKGADWAHDAIVGRETVEHAGGRVVRVHLMEGRSTRALIKKIVEQGAEAARSTAQEDS